MLEDLGGALSLGSHALAPYWLMPTPCPNPEPLSVNVDGAVVTWTFAPDFAVHVMRPFWKS